MRIIASIAAVAVAATAINGTALAHHGWDAYDAAKQQKVTGTIAELKWGVGPAQITQGQLKAHVLQVFTSVGQGHLHQVHQIVFGSVGGMGPQLLCDRQLPRVPTRPQGLDQIRVGSKVPIKAAPGDAQPFGQTQHPRLVKAAFHHRRKGGVQPIALSKAMGCGWWWGGARHEKN